MNLNLLWKSFLVGLSLMFLSSCAHVSEDGRTFYGWGRFKNKDIEIESNSPLQELISVSPFGAR